jgi:hypothetical protein
VSAAKFGVTFLIEEFRSGKRGKFKKGRGIRKLDTYPRKVENGGKIRLEKRF